MTSPFEVVHLDDDSLRCGFKGNVRLVEGRKLPIQGLELSVELVARLLDLRVECRPGVLDLGVE